METSSWEPIQIRETTFLEWFDKRNHTYPLPLNQREFDHTLVKLELPEFVTEVALYMQKYVICKR